MIAVLDLYQYRLPCPIIQMTIDLGIWNITYQHVEYMYGIDSNILFVGVLSQVQPLVTQASLWLLFPQLALKQGLSVLIRKRYLP